MPSRAVGAVLFAFACSACTQQAASDRPVAASSVPSPALSAPGSVASQAPPPAPTCPPGMLLIQGGTFEMGAPWADRPTDSDYRHRETVQTFCLDETEFTARAYLQCVQGGGCQPAHDNHFSCTGTAANKLDHPINCVDWFQASAACKHAGKRLPTEQEWEYAARAGAEQRTYSWGEASPEGRSCYNLPSTCPVRSFPPGAFGLHDMTGNVWEWTASAYTTQDGWTLPEVWRVYRGGSYSRRFPKWMKGWLRNRFRPEEWGAHLGFRCAADLPGAPRTVAEPSPSPPAPKIVPVRHARAPQPPATASAKPPVDRSVVVSRDPQFDADCLRYKPGRPVAVLVRGGSFAERQRIKQSRNCDNRDVGVDFNSVCCPGSTASPPAASAASTSPAASNSAISP